MSAFTFVPCLVNIYMIFVGDLFFCKGMKTMIDW